MKTVYMLINSQILMTWIKQKNITLPKIGKNNGYAIWFSVLTGKMCQMFAKHSTNSDYLDVSNICVMHLANI